MNTKGTLGCLLLVVVATGGALAQDYEEDRIPVIEELAELESTTAMRDALYGLLQDSSDQSLASDYAFLQTARGKKIAALQRPDGSKDKVLLQPLPDLYHDPQKLRNELYDLLGQATDKEVAEHYAAIQDGRKKLMVLKGTWEKHLREQKQKREILPP